MTDMLGLSKVFLIAQHHERCIEILTVGLDPQARALLLAPKLGANGRYSSPTLVEHLARHQIVAQPQPDLSLALVEAPESALKVLRTLLPFMRAGGTVSLAFEAQETIHSATMTTSMVEVMHAAPIAPEEFGFGSSQPTPASPNAQALFDAISAAFATKTALDQAQAHIPEYTGQYAPSDYIAEAAEAHNRAIDALYAASTRR